MIVVDTSALAAVLFDEPERTRFISVLAMADAPRLSAATLVEIGIVIQARKSDAGVSELDLLLNRSGTVIETVDDKQAALARHAFRLYGKGRHPAGLNFGDCFTYALAKTTGFPVLAKGSDFARTDIAVVEF